jgi:hypothetical protein
MPRRIPKDAASGRGTAKHALKGLYLLCFHFDELGERNRTGSFQMVVEAGDPLAAVNLCRSRLRALKKMGDLFTEPTTIYIEGVFGLSGSFSRPVMVNYDVGDTPIDPAARICSLVPTQRGVPDLNGWGFDPDSSVKPGPDGSRVESPFLDFGGQAAYAARAKERLAASERIRPTAPAVASRARVTPGEERKGRGGRSPADKACKDALAATLAEISGRHSKT